MARPPYRIARQEHLGDILDRLGDIGRLSWRWDYDVPGRRAIYNVRPAGGEWSVLDTRRAERLAQAECDALAIRWRPVPHPGGEDQRAEVIRWLAEDENPADPSAIA